MIGFKTNSTTSAAEQKYSDEKQLYDYLFMKFIHLYHKEQPNTHNQYPQLKYLCQEKQNQRDILDLFMQKANQLTLQQNEKYQLRTVEKFRLLKKLIQRYPIIFAQILNQDSSWEALIFSIIKNGCLKQLTELLSERQPLKKCQKQFEIELRGVVDMLICSFIISEKITLIYLEKKQLFTLVGQRIIALLSQHLTKNSRDISIQQQVIGKTEMIIFQELNRIFGLETESDQIALTFQKQYQDFLSFYKVQEMSLSQNLFQLHHVKHLLATSQKINNDSLSLLKSNLQGSFQLKNQKLVSINFFNIHQSFNQQKILINRSLLTAFINNPYQTSLFVLYKLLSSSEIKDVNKFFIHGNSQKFIDPLLFMFVDKKLIDNLNAEAFSLSVWISTEIWLKYTQGKVKENLNSKKDIQPAAYQRLAFKDPRKIYSVKQDSYPPTEPSFLLNPQPSSKLIINSLQDFENQFKRPLIYTIVMYLLALNVQTTILKYFPIQNDIIKEMVQGELLPFLLVKNYYNIGEKMVASLSSMNQVQKTSQCQENEQVELIKSVQGVQSLQELEELQKNYRSKSKQVTQKQQATALTEVLSKQLSLPLPWMHVIQSKQFLLPLLSKPAGYELALRIIQRNPNLSLKLYENYLPKMIFAQMEQRQYAQQMENKENAISANQYRFGGNRNVKLRKSMDYLNQTKRQVNHKLSVQKNKRDEERKFEAMKKIMQFYRQNSQDQTIKKACSKFLQLF